MVQKESTTNQSQTYIAQEQQDVVGKDSICKLQVSRITTPDSPAIAYAIEMCGKGDDRRWILLIPEEFSQMC
jgi:hypothetical protein